MQPVGSEFNKSLAKEYMVLAKFESEEMADFLDADRFAAKGLAAAQDRPTQPDEVYIRDLPEQYVPQLTDARARLIEAYGHGVRERYPAEAATAQAKFDCWLEQQEENYQPTHIAACRQAFVQAMRTIYTKEEARLSRRGAEDVSRAAETAPSAAGREMLIFFDFDDATIKRDELAKIDRIASRIEQDGTQNVVAIGHADRAGPDAYNDELSMKRAKAIRDALVDRGVSSGAISVDGKGESEPRARTADGVPNAENRRVQISVR